MNSSPVTPSSHWTFTDSHYIKDSENFSIIQFGVSAKSVQEKRKKERKHLSCEIINIFAKDEFSYCLWNKVFAEIEKNVLNKLCSLCAQHLISSAALHETVSPMLSWKNCKTQIKLSRVALTLNIWQCDMYSIAALNEIRISQNSIKFVFCLSKTKPF